MRDTDPVAKSLDQEGDTEAAAANIGVARTVLGQLANQMRLGGLQVGSRHLTLPDGTTVRAVIAGGVKKIFISVPRIAGGIVTPEPETPEPPPTPQPEIPLVVPDDIPLAIFNAIFEPDSDYGAIFRPLYLNDTYVTRPDALPRPIYPHGKPAVRYRHIVGGGNQLQFARIDQQLQQPLGLAAQPTMVTMTSSNGNAIDPTLYINTPKAVHDQAIVTSPRHLGYIQMPDLFVDTVYTIEGQGTTSNKVKGLILVERDTELAALIPPNGSSAVYSGGVLVAYSEGSTTINGYTAPTHGANSTGNYIVVPCANGFQLTYSFTQLSGVTTPFPVNYKIRLYQFATDTRYQSPAVVAHDGASAYTASGDLLGSPLVRSSFSPQWSAAWTQTGGNLTVTLGDSDPSVSGYFLLTSVPANGTYTAQGELTLGDVGGNTIVLPVTITLSFA